LVKKFLLILVILTASLAVQNESIAQQSVKTVNENPLATVENIIPGTDLSKSPELKGSATVVNLKSDKLDYYEDKDQFVATGNVVIDAENQGTKVEAQEVIYDHGRQEMIAQKKVKITKNSIVINGDYAKFDLNKESVLIDKPNTLIKEIKINSDKAKLYGKNAEALKGQIEFNDENIEFLMTNQGIKLVRKPEEDKGKVRKTKLSYNIRSKEIRVKEQEYNNLITAYKTTIRINKINAVYIPHMELTTDKETNRIETNLPEVGSDQEIGIYAGYGYVFQLPKGATLKTAPLITFGQSEGSNIGIGGMARFMNRDNKTEIFYSTLKDKFLVRGEQRLYGDTTKLQYGTNSYMNNGFFGDQRPQYIVEVVDNRKIGSAYNIDVLMRSSAGFVEQEGNYSTLKAQVQGTFRNNKPLWSISDKEGNYFSCLGLESNASLSAYGTGHSYGVARIGPTLMTKLGRLRFFTAYYQGAIYGETPFFYDRYDYGRSNAYLNADIKITKYFSLGYLGSLNLTKDNWEKKLMAENLVYLWIGPDDFKFKIGYDTKRERTVFDFNLLIGQDNSKLEFDKLKIIQR
jgi:hypothetical protein